MSEPTWKPYGAATHGRLTTAEKNSQPATAFAFPRARKEPMTDAAHVRDAMAMFNQVGEVTDSERDLAFANFQKAARDLTFKLRKRTGISSDCKRLSGNPVLLIIKPSDDHGSN